MSKSNLTFDRAKDIEVLCSKIFESTKRYIGVTTMKRLLGYISDSRKTNEYTLNTVSMYLGYKSWNDLCSSMRVDSDWDFPDEKVYVDNLQLGEKLTVSYWDREVSFVVVSHNDKKALQVIKSVNSSLKMDDVLMIEHLEVGQKLEAREVYRGNLTGNYRTNHELSEIVFEDVK